jgi:hypothetical protein
VELDTEAWRRHWLTSLDTHETCPSRRSRYWLRAPPPSQCRLQPRPFGVLVANHDHDRGHDSSPRPRRATTTVPETTTTTVPLPPLLGLAIEPVASGVSQPVLLLSPPNSDRRFVVERVGRVLELTEDGEIVEEPYLDLRDRVNSGGIEQGLLGMAFHPDFATNGRLFVYYYHGAATTRLVEFTATASGPEVETEKVLLTLDQPTVRHNGGMLEFGPGGNLYLALGEGGAASTHSQNPATLLSSILRLDVDRGDPYAVPADNPFVDGGGAPEVWAFGLRNPWRFAIDPVTELIYIGDVGHERWEEINVVPLSEGGLNFGWLRMEGSSCFQRGCDPEAENLVLPVHEYSHDEGCSVTVRTGLSRRGDSRVGRDLLLFRLVWGMAAEFPLGWSVGSRSHGVVDGDRPGEQLRRGQRRGAVCALLDWRGWPDRSGARRVASAPCWTDFHGSLRAWLPGVSSR